MIPDHQTDVQFDRKYGRAVARSGRQAGWLRATALNLGVGAVPQSPLLCRRRRQKGQYNSPGSTAALLNAGD